MYPFNDKYMTYDLKLHRYQLTQDYIVDILGIDIERRIASNKGVNATAVINQFLKSVSTIVYNYIYSHNTAKALQWIIAKCPSARDIIQNAMGEQAKYMLTVGDMSRSTDESKRRMALDIQAKMIIDNQEVEETGAVLSYIGSYSFVAPNYEQGEY